MQRPGNKCPSLTLLPLSDHLSVPPTGQTQPETEDLDPSRLSTLVSSTARVLTGQVEKAGGYIWR